MKGSANGKSIGSQVTKIPSRGLKKVAERTRLYAQRQGTPD